MEAAGNDIVGALIAQIGAMPPDVKRQVIATAKQVASGAAFIPTPGPQEQAQRCEADILLFGGEGGGGKTALGVGLALTNHRRSLLMRRVSTQLRGMTELAVQFNKTHEGFNGSYPQRLRTRDQRLIEFGAAQYAGDELAWRGIPHDYLYIDEAGEWLKSQIRNLIGWVRAPEGQRTRVVLGTNPPTTSEGDWMVEMFAPWLDPDHTNPAEQGELRWFVMDDENDIAVDGPGYYLSNGDAVPADQVEALKQSGQRPLKAMSRTFIRSRLSDNPYLSTTDYGAKLDMLPEPLRSAVRDGNFMIARTDHVWQVIPSDWVRQAQARWKPNPPEGVPMCSIGVDIAQGGDDSTTLAPRYDGWYAPIIRKPGSATPTGNEVAGLVVAHRRNNATIVLDMGGGYGGASFLRLCDNGLEDQIVSYKGAAATSKRTVDGKLKFTNTRIAAYWKLREALDPAQPGGSTISLPPSNTLFADLTAMRFKESPHGLAPASDSTKEEITKRLGRSPDEGDAVVMAWWGGNTIANIEGGWKSGRTAATPTVNVGHAQRKRHY